MNLQRFYRNNRNRFRKEGGRFEISSSFISLVYQGHILASVTIDGNHLLRLDDTILGVLGVMRYFDLAMKDM